MSKTASAAVDRVRVSKTVAREKRKMAPMLERSGLLVFVKLLSVWMGLLVLCMSIGLVIGLPVLYWYAGSSPRISSDLVHNSISGKLQFQISELDRKLEDGINSVRKEFDEIMENELDEMDWKLKTLNLRTDLFEKFIDGFGTKSLLSKKEFGEFFEEFKTASKTGGEVSVNDEIRDYVRQIVEKEIERYKADWVGMVDYALTSGDGKVLRHSEPYWSKFWGVWGNVLSRLGSGLPLYLKL